ncbi:MAG: hypothetical protein CL912_21880 [Deltaproteobacteria bacterium]|nr:hypothetical protein [Deltaproteobacteria bacterium]
MKTYSVFVPRRGLSAQGNQRRFHKQEFRVNKTSRTGEGSLPNEYVFDHRNDLMPINRLGKKD